MLEQIVAFKELLFLSLAVWVAYLGIIECGYVSDDIEGVLQYDGKLKKFDYGHASKWIIYKLIGKDNKANHILNILIHNANVILLYSFLSNYFPTYAFATCLLFAIYPLTVQAVGWISGRGYPISLMLLLLSYNLMLLMPAPSIHSWYFGVFCIFYSILYYLSIEAQFAALMTPFVHLLLGNYFLAVLSASITAVAGAGIIKEVIGKRANTFKEQNLASGTSFRPSKFVLAMKSLYYFTKLCFFPKRMGLYHEYLYHHNEKSEKEDRYFWLGFAIFIAMVVGIIYGNSVIKFSIIWYLCYIFIFLNWITIHQMFTERYTYIPLVGVCLFVAFSLHSHPLALAFLIGLLLMRTWVHLPTYNDEVMFYQSNIWNFPNSEIAFANLGVTYLKCNLTGSAMDMWQIAIKINPDYDVGYYNLHSIIKKNGDLPKAIELLEKAVNAKECHFRDTWSKELADLKHEVEFVKEFEAMRTKLIELEKDNTKKEQATKIRTQLEEINQLRNRLDEQRKRQLSIVEQDQSNLKARMSIIEQAKAQIVEPSIEQLVKMRDINFNNIKQALSQLEDNHGKKDS